MSNQELAKAIWKQYQDGLAYQKKLNLKETCENCTNFYEGNQWPKVTEKTKHLPRPVINFIKFIVNNKKSNVLASKIKMIYKPLVFNADSAERAAQGADEFTDFAEHIKKEVKQETLDNKAVLDGIKKGTYIFHYFWDRNQKTGMAKYTGGLNGQIIDMLNIVFANPREIDEQKQKWIIICGRENTDSLKELAKAKGIPAKDIELIAPDDDTERNYDAEEQDGEEYTTVLTKYFRKDGEVYYTKSTSQTMVQGPTPLTPNAKDVNIEVTEEGKTNEDLEDVGPDTAKDVAFKMTLYPIAVGQWDDRDKCIYGIGEVEQLIPIQKSINFNYAMMLMSVQNVGFPKIAVSPRALQGKALTNTPGEIIVDYTPGFNGIKYLQPPTSTIVPISLTDKMIELTRTTTGATEVANGEVLGANMSGSAIIALQNQAKVPIEDIQKKFWRVHEKIAKIWEQFFKAYYKFNTEYAVEENEQYGIKSFNGKQYQDMEFETTIDVGPGSAYSESMSIALLENSLNRGDIDFNTFVDLYPDDAMPFKARLKSKLKSEQLPAEISKMIASNPQLYQEVMNLVAQAQNPVPNTDIMG